MINVLFPEFADTDEKKLAWAKEQLAALYLDNHNLERKVRARVDYDEIKSERDTAQARIAQLLRREDEVKYYCIKEIEFNHDWYHALNEILNILK